MIHQKSKQSSVHSQNLGHFSKVVHVDSERSCGKEAWFSVGTVKTMQRGSWMDIFENQRPQ